VELGSMVTTFLTVTSSIRRLKEPPTTMVRNPFRILSLWSYYRY
jgi:hypothetical protein